MKAELFMQRVSDLRTQPGVEERLAEIRRAVADACLRSGRNPQDVRLIAVTKTVAPEAIAPLVAAGVADLAENRWQHARDMLAASRANEATWHFIGHLQSNKAKYVVPRFDWCHSVDSLELAAVINATAAAAGKVMNCLLQVNVSGESSKSGVHPETVADVLRVASRLPHITVRGLMTMAPKAEDPEQARPVFRALREMLGEAREALQDARLTELSMGMSDDFAIAVEEGATMIRIGRHLMAAFAGDTLQNGEPGR